MMTSAAKRMGSKAEREVVVFLRSAGFPHAERRIAGARLDRGDIAGIPAVAIEVKDHGRTELAAWVDEARAEAGNADARWPVVWHKRRGRGSAGDWFVTMDGATFAAMLAEALR
jgi:hypothetical protein